MIFQQEIK